MTPRTVACQAPLCPWNFPGKNTGVGTHSLLQGIFSTQESNSGLLYCRQILYHLSHQGSPNQLKVPFLVRARMEGTLRESHSTACDLSQWRQPRPRWELIAFSKRRRKESFWPSIQIHPTKILNTENFSLLRIFFPEGFDGDSCSSQDLFPKRGLIAF